jgi:hypothetical protein
MMGKSRKRGGSLLSDPLQKTFEARVNVGFDDEKRFNDRFISHRKKAFCKKQKIPFNNLYEKAFTFLNNKIMYQIDIERYSNDRNSQSKAILTIGNYPEIYKKSSSQVLKLIKSKPPPQNSQAKNELKILQNIKKLDLKDVMERKVNFAQKASTSRLYEHNEKFQMELDITKRMNNIQCLSDRLLAKIKPDYNAESLQKINIPKSEGSFLPIVVSKNAYLASLNYNFRNPLL